MPQLKAFESQKEILDFIKSIVAKNQMEIVLHGDSLPKLRADFAENIKELSRIRPVTAFWVADSTNVDDVFVFMGKIMAKASEITNVQPSDEDKAFISQWIQRNMVNTALKNLTSNIRKIAWQVGPCTRFTKGRLLGRLSGPMTDDPVNAVATSIKELFDKATPMQTTPAVS